MQSIYNVIWYMCIRIYHMGRDKINEHLYSNPDLSKVIICIKFAVLLLVNFSDIYVWHICKPYEITVSWTTTEVWYTMTSFYIQLMALNYLISIALQLYQLISYTLPIHFKDNHESRKYNVHVDILHPKTAHLSEVDLNFMYWELDFFPQAWSIHHTYPNNNTLCPLVKSGWFTSNSLLYLYTSFDHS